MNDHPPAPPATPPRDHAGGGGSAGDGDPLVVAATALLGAGPDGVVLLDEGLRYRWANAAARQALDIPDDDAALVGADVRTLRPWVAGGRVEDAVLEVLGSRRARTVPSVVSAHGRCFDVDVVPAARGATVRFRDVTDRVGAEEALRASEAHYRVLLEQLADGIAVVAAEGDGRLTIVNERLCEMTGFSRAELLSMRVPDLIIEARSPDLPARVDRLARGETLLTRRLIRRKDGTLLPAELSTRRSGSRIQSVIRDVTEREAFEEHRRAVQKLEALGLLAGSVAHDFNNFLAAIHSHVELALGEVEGIAAAEAVRAELEDVRRAARRAAALTRELLTFSRRQSPEPATFPLGDAARGIETMLRRLLRPAVDLMVRVSRDAGRVRADLGRLEQAVMNLVVNARDAMHGGGTVVVDVSARTVAEPAVVGITAQLIPPGEYAVLSVTDTGVGLTPGTAARVFDPLFTTKPPGAGTGLGLWTVHAVVTQAGGHVTVDSVPGAGSTFSIWLRAATPDDAGDPLATAGAEARG